MKKLRNVLAVAVIILMIASIGIGTVSSKWPSIEPDTGLLPDTPSDVDGSGILHAGLKRPEPIPEPYEPDCISCD